DLVTMTKDRNIFNGLFSSISNWRTKKIAKNQCNLSEGEVVAIFVNGNFDFFARVDSIDKGDEAGWFRFDMVKMTYPVVSLAWILKPIHCKMQPFALEGEMYQIGKIDRMSFKKQTERNSSVGGKIINLSDRKERVAK
ncbi:MAG: hypothetical protein JZU65_03180, partial [Chlorobium sp.]|nr:hypothetical protein [Chlorobium sp.]